MIDAQPRAGSKLWSTRRSAVVLIVGLTVYLGGTTLAGSAMELRDVREAELQRDRHGLFAPTPGPGPWMLRPQPNDGETLAPIRRLHKHHGQWRPVSAEGLADGDDIWLIGPRRSLWKVLGRALRLPTDGDGGDG